MADEKRSDVLKRGLERLSGDLRSRFTLCGRCSGEGNLWHLPEFAGKNKDEVKVYPSPDSCADCEGAGLRPSNNRGCDTTVGDILCARIIYEVGLLNLCGCDKTSCECEPGTCG